jgi:hypothetical protein
MRPPRLKRRRQAVITKYETDPMKSRLRPAILCVAIWIVTGPSIAEACGCGGALPSSVAFTQATAVFIGTVVDVTGGMPAPIVATFDPMRVYRGQHEERIVVAGNGTSCDVAFSKGVTYLVYADDTGGVLMTHKCTRTRTLPTAAEDVRYLDNVVAGRPQAILHGDVFRRVTYPDGRTVQQALFEPLEVVAMRGDERRSVLTDQWGPFQIVLSPGDYEVWVERAGRRVTTAKKLRLGAGGERAISFTADYQ